MSDNLSFSKQGAATQADKPAHGMGNASTKAQLDEAAELEASEGSNDADNTEADTARATTGKAAAVKAAKGAKAAKTSPKKRSTAANDEEDGSPKKKRAPAKAKATKTETQVEDDAVDEGTKTPEPEEHKSDNAEGDDVQVPVTPMKGKRTLATETKTPQTPKTPKNVATAKDKTEPPTPKSVPPKNVARKRSTAEKVADKVSLPITWAEASEADKELVAMKKRGLSWNEIRAMWLEKTGQDTASSTLPNRYKRLQVIMMQLEDREKSMLSTIKEEVEANWKNTKWAMIAAEMEKKGANKYPTEFLQKEWKKLEAARAEAATAAGGEALLAAVREASQGDDHDDEEGEGEGEQQGAAAKGDVDEE